MPAKLRLVICHQNRLLRESLTSALVATDHMEVTGIDGGQVDGVASTAGEFPDILVIDAGLPDMGAFRLVQSLRTSPGGPRTILLVSSSAPDLLDSCLQAGADGCVIDDDTLDDLREAIENVVSGRSYCSPQVARKLFTHTHDDQPVAPRPRLGGRSLNAQLTRRELEILRLIARRDLSNKQIARELHLSVYTVKNHVHSIIEKLCAEDRTAAARYAARHGLLSEPTA
jgi:DNA-binding NarL/FixJ family response regulator